MFADIATIDGPPASGKTTMASILAKELGLTHLDSGSIFRSLTCYYMKNGINLNNPAEVIDSLPNVQLHLSGKQIFLDGKDITSEIRTPEVTNNVCLISNLLPVRKFVKEVQLSAAKSGKVVCEGRKVGIEIFPNAKVKFFLTADQETRARRRFYQFQKTNPQIKFEDVYRDLKQRENTELINGVLKMPENAIIIDNTNLSIEETFLVMKAYML